MGAEVAQYAFFIEPGPFDILENKNDFCNNDAISACCYLVFHPNPPRFNFKISRWT